MSSRKFANYIVVKMYTISNFKSLGLKIVSLLKTQAIKLHIQI